MDASAGRWRGRLELNQRMRESKSLALPLGDAPMVHYQRSTARKRVLHTCRNFFTAVQAVSAGSMEPGAIR